MLRCQFASYEQERAELQRLLRELQEAFPMPAPSPYALEKLRELHRKLLADAAPAYVPSHSVPCEEAAVTAPLEESLHQLSVTVAETNTPQMDDQPRTTASSSQQLPPTGAAAAASSKQQAPSAGAQQ